MSTSTVLLKEHFDNFSGTFIVTDKEAKVIYVNKKIQSDTGYSVGEVVGKNPGQLWGGCMDPLFYKHLWKCIATDQIPFVSEVRNKKKNGDTYLEELHITPILNAQGEAKFFIEIQPSAASRGQSFSQYFATSFAHQRQATWLAVDFFLRTFKLTKQNWESLTASSNSNNQIIFFLESILVEPTQVIYAERRADQDLVMVAQNDGEAFDRLYTKYYSQVRQYFLRRVGYDNGLAEDLTQETFMRAFRYLHRFSASNASYLTYLLRIAHNLLVSHYRLARHNLLDDIIIAENKTAFSIDYEKIFDLKLIWQMVERLAPFEQRILKLKYQEDLSVKDIAEIVKKSENAVKLHLSRAREKLRQSMNSTH